MLAKISLLIFVLATLKVVTANSEWHYKFTYTTNINSQMSLNCGVSSAIWIGWSHYGTRHSIIKRNEKSYPEQQKLNPFNNDRVFDFPNENDCWMNFTEKIAEQCNGAQNCDLSAQPTYIHKCGKISDYLYVSYKCIHESTIQDICHPTTRTFSSDSSFFIKSSDFPDEYPSSLDCSCSLTSTNSQQSPLKLEFLWFSLQDNDYLSIFNKNLTGWINPTYEMPILSKNNKIRFITDDSLAYKGFWLKISPRKACRDDWQLIGNNCIKVFTDNLNWRSANKHCQQMGGNLLKIDDVVDDLKLTQYMKSFHPDVTSYWIGLRKYVDSSSMERWMWSANSTGYNDVSWWPWVPRTSVQNQDSVSHQDMAYGNNCVTKQKNEDGYFTTSCGSENRNAFICQTSTLDGLQSTTPAEVRLKCGSTSEIEADIIELSKFESIGASSIQNYQTNRKKESTTTEPAIIIQPEQVAPVVVSPLPTTLKNALIKQFSTSTRAQASITEQTNPWNTNVLAGIIAGIGLVIVVINLAVLFVCRRNLKKFLKSTKDGSKPGQKLDGSIPTSEMLQDYFEAFSTLHNLHNKPNLSPEEQSKAQQKIINDINAFTLNHKQHLLTLQQKSNANTINNNRTASMNSGDEPLMNESAKLFYNSQQFFKNMTLKQTEAALASTSAFKPFIREVNDNNLPMENLLVRQHFIQQQQLQQQANQYDKISHIQAGQSIPNFENQYAHTYECLDPNGNVEIRRGASQNNILLSSPNFDPQFNVSTSSTSSSSGASSTQHLIRNNNQHDSIMSNGHSNQRVNMDALVGQQLQALTPAQLHSLLNSGNGTGAWSPDSAYYSSIPTYGQFGMHFNNQNNGNSSGQMIQQQFSSFNFGLNNGENNNFKSHLV